MVAGQVNTSERIQRLILLPYEGNRPSAVKAAFEL